MTPSIAPKTVLTLALAGPLTQIIEDNAGGLPGVFVKIGCNRLCKPSPEERSWRQWTGSRLLPWHLNQHWTVSP